MRRLRRWAPVAAAALLLGACLAGIYLTAPANPGPLQPVKTGPAASVVDDSLLRRAHDLASTVDSAQEQDLAREALRLADHELDQAFDTALRVAAFAQPPSSGPFRQLAARVEAVKARVAADTARVAALTKASASDSTPSDDLELAQAQLALDQDDLEDSQQDLARAGGDARATVQKALEQHQADEHETTMPKVVFAGNANTVVEQAQSWIGLRRRQQDVSAAEREAAAKARDLSNRHNALEAAQSAAAPADQDRKAALARLQGLASARKTMAELDRRIQDIQQLDTVYKRWSAVLDARVRGALQTLLRSLAVIFAVLLAVIVVDTAIRQAFARKVDPRRAHQLRTICIIGVQLAGMISILLLLFGPPTQLTTMIGLVTAGLTVVLKDFIVSFFGWFALLGRNGVRPGDWVEIEGVSGEVIEIGVLKTVLLEMGNQAGAGHPTGRHVSFVNSYAIEGHYFNFSTQGQWLWDNLQVSLPQSGDPYRHAAQIRDLVDAETAPDARGAEQDWERVTNQFGVRAFSARASMELRPSATGLDVVVHYITRAPHRQEVRSRLFEKIVTLLQGTGAAPQNAAITTGQG